MRIVPSRLQGRLRAGLLTRFAVAGLIAVVLLGVVLVRTLSTEVRQRSLADARQEAQLIDETIIQPKLTAADLATGLSKRQIALIDKELHAALSGPKPHRRADQGLESRRPRGLRRRPLDHRAQSSRPRTTTARTRSTATRHPRSRISTTPRMRTIGASGSCSRSTRRCASRADPNIPPGRRLRALPAVQADRRRHHGGHDTAVPACSPAASRSCTSRSSASWPGPQRSCAARRRRTSTSRFTTRSPACRTEASSTTGPAGRSSPRSARAAVSPSCCSTSTGSRRSTTRSATRTATCCCRRSAAACTPSSARATPSPASAATSSACCCRRWPTTPTRCAWPRRCAGALRQPVRAAGRSPRPRGEHRHRPLPQARRGRRHPLAARGRRDVPGEGRSRRVPAVRRRPRRVQPRQARAGRRASPRDRRGRAVPPLPAEGEPDRRSDRRRRGARPLAAPRRAASCRRTSSCRSPSAPA